jgi:uncharacterized membrane protein YeaQ/YmgE (transglycosylase-associated protein family)
MKGGTNMTATVILVILWVVLGVIAAALAPRIFKRPPPFGTRVEVVICAVTAVAVGFADRWALSLPTFQMPPPLPFIVMLVEPFLSAWVVIWILRQVKQPRATG